MGGIAMNDYWRNYYNRKAEEFPTSPLKQVDRTIGGKEMDYRQLELTVEAVIQVLELQGTDNVTDLCCGNGLITKAISQQVERVLAVDFSKSLIDYARRFNSSGNIEYLVKDVLKLDREFFKGSNKLYMRDSVSCLDSEGLSSLLGSIGKNSSFEKLYIAGIPDLTKLSSYYDSDEKMAFYRQREAAGKPHIGNWWTKSEIKALVRGQDLIVSCFAQNNELASAYYRFDCLIEKRGATSLSGSEAR
jgi:SAM-dependent methyltransferase